jgi:hypothetical protein
MAKKDRLDRRSGYYQTIEKFFIDLRGAPFFLSSRELDIISKWEEQGIPLRIVLEGIKGSFEQRGNRGGKRRRPYNLDYCHSFVMRAFHLHQDRRVGRKKSNVLQGEKEKKTKILLEVERFLADIPEELQPLKPIYARLHTKLSDGEVTEEELEKAEEIIERLIKENLPAAQADAITAEIRSEFGRISGAKFDQIFRVKALKAEREKYKIPHVSPFYY